MENEVKNCCIDWAAHKIEWKGQMIPVDSVWWECYNWWQEYEKIEGSLYDEWYDFSSIHSNDSFIPLEGGGSLWETKYDSEENEEICKELFKKTQSKEIELANKLEEYLILLVKTRKYMWT